MRFPVLVFLLICLAAAICAPASAASIALRPSATWTERAAAGDLQRAIYASTGRLLGIGPLNSADREVIAVGFSPVKDVDLSAKRLGDQGFVLKTISYGGRTILVAAGACPLSTSYAAYTLAEHYGAGFYLGGDALPSKRTAFAILKLDVLQKPVFKVRGVLPWYNFFDSPTTWNIEDYRLFIDQLAKSKNNFLGFHSYDQEPFCAYPDAEGKVVAGAPLVSTKQPTWGTVSMATSDFAPCARSYFEKPYFGAECSMGYKTPEEGIANAKKLLAKALSYAKARGVKTCVGFEVTGDPTTPGELDKLELRLKNLLKTYPMLDYVWIWEPEAMGLNGIDPRGARTDFGAYDRRWQDAFADISDPRRRTEAVRVGIYALAAHRILKREAPAVKMILSAWGGDNHLHFTDFYPGYDKILPKDIIFSALDNILASDTVSVAYGKLSKDREFWPIPWFEYDGDQWCPQPNTKRFYNAARDALHKGAKGLLAIHWRTRDVEESHAYISQFAWNPELGYEDFYKSYARKAYGDESVAGLLMGLQDMGYRWVGGGGQIECGGFSWNTARDEAVEQMNALFAKYAAVMPSERLGDLNDMREWLESYDRVARVLRSDGRLCELLNSLRADDRKATSQESALIKQDLAAARTDLSTAIVAASRRITNRGELGILATINTKAWANLLELERKAQDIAGVRIEPDARASAGDLAVSSILRGGTGFAGKPTRISAVVHSASPQARAQVMYRPAGSKAFLSRSLRFVSPGRLEGQVPALGAGLVEYYIRVLDGQRSAVWPLGAPKTPAYISLVPTAPAGDSRHVGHLSKTGSIVSRVTCSAGPMLVTLSWPDSPQTRAFRVMRRADGSEWKQIAAVRDNWLEDRDIAVGSTYCYRILDADSKRVIAESDNTTVARPPLPAAPDVSAVAGPGRVRLIWKPDIMGCSAYRAYRADKQEGPFTMVSDAKPQFDNTRGVRICDCPSEPGKEFYYAVRGISLDGSEGPMSKPIPASPIGIDAKPVLALKFDGKDPVAVKGCMVEQGIPCVRTGPGAYVQLPHDDAFNADADFSVEFAVKMRVQGTMPVFISHGSWNIDGFFIQYFGSHVRFCVAGVGTLDAGSIDIGKWTSVAVTYDGTELALYLDGRKSASQPAMGQMTVCRRPFYIGRYDIEASDFAVDGWIGGVTMYNYAISPEQAKAYHEEMVREMAQSGS